MVVQKLQVILEKAKEGFPILVLAEQVALGFIAAEVLLDYVDLRVPYK